LTMDATSHTTKNYGMLVVFGFGIAGIIAALIGFASED
jgi:hypothetical protein